MLVPRWKYHANTLGYANVGCMIFPLLLKELLNWSRSNLERDCGNKTGTVPIKKKRSD